MGDRPAVSNWTPGSTGDQIGVFRCATPGASCTWIGDTTGKTGGAVRDLRNAGSVAATFTAPDGFFPGDVPVIGNWNASGRKRVGIFRSIGDATHPAGQWFVDTNGNGVYDPEVDQIFIFGLPPQSTPGGVPDQPIVGFWSMP